MVKKVIFITNFLENIVANLSIFLALETLYFYRGDGVRFVGVLFFADASS